MKIFIIVQGSMKYYNEINKYYEKFSNVIYSGWKKDKNILENEKYFLINRKPITSGVQNINYQTRSTFNGLKYARKLGATHALKIRSDMYFNNLKLLLSLLDDKTMYFPAACTNTKEPYYVDYFQFGPINEMIKLWNIPIKFKQFHKKYPEFYITKNFFKKCKHIDVKYFYPFCKENGIECFWIKNNFEVFKSFEEEHFNFNNIKTEQ